MSISIVNNWFSFNSLENLLIVKNVKMKLKIGFYKIIIENWNVRWIYFVN